jgi:ankyrin repeat protein
MCFALYLLFKGRSALHIASFQDNVQAANILLLNGANVNAKDKAVSISVC